MISRLTNDEKYIAQFQRLALSVVPPLEKEHRNLCNEMNYVVTTLNRISLRYLNFTLPKQTSILALYACGYSFFKRAGNWRGTSDSDVPNARPVPPNIYVYVNMDGDLLRTLRLLTIPVPPNTSEEKLRKIEEVRASLMHFLEKEKAGGNLEQV